MKLNVRNIITALILLFPVWAHAEVHTGIELAKTATYDYATQTGVIKLENFVGQVTKKMNLGKPADVVLVLDGSGSMNSIGGKDYWNMDDLCDAVDLFAKILRDACTDDVHHRISMIIYGGDSELLCDFTDVDTSVRITSSYPGKFTAATTYYDFSALIKNRCGFTTGDHVYRYKSGTMTQMALGHASYIITKSTAITTAAEALYDNNKYWADTWNGDPALADLKGATTGPDCNRYVVLMTDGALSGSPTYKTSHTKTTINEEDEGGETNQKSEDQAVYVANALKAAGDLSTTIYTVGFLRDADAKPGVNNCLNNISSNNRPQPTDPDYDDNDSDYPVDKIPHDYYIRIERTVGGTSGTDLENIFKMISGEVVAGCAAVDLDPTSTKITDVINGSVFKLPAGINDANLKENIKAYLLKCTDYDQMAADPYKFEDPTHYAVPSGVTFSLTNVSTNPTITVSGFDYSANWCGEEYVSGSYNSTTDPLKTQPHGYKLVIEIPYTVKNYEGGHDEKIPTNLTGSQFSGDIKGTSPTETLKQAYPEPSVALYELTIQRTGLKAGESAIYKITKGSDLLYTVVLTGTGSTVQQKVLYVPDGSVVVTETGWGWANVPTSPSLTKVIGPSPNNAPTYSFSGSNSGVKNPEDVKKNEFDQ